LRFDLGDGTLELAAPFFDPIGLFRRSGGEALSIRGEAGSEREESGEQAPLRLEPALRRADKVFEKVHEADPGRSYLTSS
jgi:hypothetical protein